MKTPSSPSLSSKTLKGDTRSIEALRSSAARDPKGMIKETSKQFEALFTQQLMKSMRDASLSTGMLDNAGTQMGTEMLDAQFAKQLTGLPGGLADVLAHQLECQLGSPPPAAVDPADTAAGFDMQGAGIAAAPLRRGPATMANAADADAAATSALAAAATALRMPAPTTPAAAAPATAAGAPASAIERGVAALGARATGSAQQRQADFLRTHQAAAQQAEAESGIPAAFMVAQAAHESGWGRHEIRNIDGSASNNLFGIKAGPGWDGPVATVTTTEYIGGKPQKVVAKFRSYGSAAESFKDYAKMLKESPRYAAVVARTAAAAPPSAQRFAQGLQRAGYATDPAYADKLTRIINTTLRMQRV